MSGWRISPDGVAGVLSVVGTAASAMSTAVDGLPAEAEAALAGTGPSPIIGDALLGFFEHHKPTLESIGNRINASVNGAVSATTAYVQGDLEMAAQQQAAAAGVAGTGVVRSTAPVGAPDQPR